MGECREESAHLHQTQNLRIELSHGRGRRLRLRLGIGRVLETCDPTEVHRDDITCQGHSGSYRPRIRTKILDY